MREESKYILTYAQIEADLFVAKATIDKATVGEVAICGQKMPKQIKSTT